MILRPAQKIEVVESNRQCKAGSIGYFICQDIISRYNAWQMVSVFTRYGKKGKRRISVLEFSTQMFDSSQFKGSDRKILDTVQFVEGLLPRPDNSTRKLRRRFGLPDPHGIGESMIIPTDMGCKNLLDLDTWDFLGYLAALSIYLNRLHHSKSSHQLATMPLLMQLAEFVEYKDLRFMSPDYMGYYIIKGLDYDAQNKDKSFEDSYLNTFNDHAKRKECLDKIIMAMVGLKDRDADHKSYILQVYRDIEIHINDVLSYYRKKKNDLKSVEKGEEEFRNGAFESAPVRPVSPRQQAALNKLSLKEKEMRTSYKQFSRDNGHRTYYSRRGE